jgi:hypothetical protein
MTPLKRPHKTMLKGRSFTVEESFRVRLIDESYFEICDCWRQSRSATVRVNIGYDDYETPRLFYQDKCWIDEHGTVKYRTKEGLITSRIPITKEGFEQQLSKTYAFYVMFVDRKRLCQLKQIIHL